MKRGKVVANGGMRGAWLALLVSFAGVMALPGVSHAASALDSVRVVPNPYNVSGRTFGPRAVVGSFEQLMFTNLPVPNASTPTQIRIYSMTLDLVASLEHSSADNQYFWDGRNSDNQYVVSGVYYYVIEHPDYGKLLGKLVIIR